MFVKKHAICSMAFMAKFVMIFSLAFTAQQAFAVSVTASSHDGNVPQNVLDGDINTRWSANGKGQWLDYDLGKNYDVSGVKLAFFKGNERAAFFDISLSTDKQNWTRVVTNQTSSGTTLYNETFTFSAGTARYVRYTGQGNDVNNWTSLTKMSVIKSTATGSTPAPISTPSTGSIDLQDWYLSIPTDTDGSGTADSIKEDQLAGGYSNSSYFYKSSDGGLVFKCPINGYKTSTNTSYTRTELREMLRRGDTGIDTSGVNKNNWVFGTASSTNKSKAGGYNGTLTATLAVNRVTTTGDSDQVGRVIVGQIHATDDEPLRLYYRKLKNNAKGSIYFAHEKEGGGDTYYELIGSRSDSASNPSDGVALNEKFSYEVKTSGLSLTVTIKRDGKSDVSKTITMDSGYNDSDQYMYFKAGVYNQNNTGTGSDYVQATFYSLENKHTGYSY